MGLQAPGIAVESSGLTPWPGRAGLWVVHRDEEEEEGRGVSLPAPARKPAPYGRRGSKGTHECTQPPSSQQHLLRRESARADERERSARRRRGRTRKGSGRTSEPERVHLGLAHDLVLCVVERGRASRGCPSRSHRGGRGARSHGRGRGPGGRGERCRALSSSAWTRLGCGGDSGSDGARARRSVPAQPSRELRPAAPLAPCARLARPHAV